MHLHYMAPLMLIRGTCSFIFEGSHARGLLKLHLLGKACQTTSRKHWLYANPFGALCRPALVALLRSLPPFAL